MQTNFPTEWSFVCTAEKIHTQNYADRIGIGKQSFVLPRACATTITWSDCKLYSYEYVQNVMYDFELPPEEVLKSIVIAVAGNDLHLPICK